MYLVWEEQRREVLLMCMFEHSFYLRAYTSILVLKGSRNSTKWHVRQLKGEIQSVQRYRPLPTRC